MNKKLGFFRVRVKHALSIFALMVLWLYSITEPLYTPTAIIGQSDHYIFPELIANKALVSHDFPGNSLSAVTQCLASTVDGIKVDVRQSKDGVLFLYHGARLEEYTKGKGIPEHHNWSDLAQVTYKNSDEHLLLLDDFLNRVGQQKTIFLAIQSNKTIDTPMVRHIVGTIAKHQLQNNVFVQSMNPITLGLVRLYDREIMVMYDFMDDSRLLGKPLGTESEPPHHINWFLKRHWVQKQIRRIIRPDLLGPRFNINSQVLQGLIKNHYPMISWTVDDPKIAQSLYKYGVKGVQSNTPHIIEGVAQRKNKTVSDAGGSRARLDHIVRINSVADIQEHIRAAKKEGKKITLAGCRHSMGGQTLSHGSILLNMLHFDGVSYNPSTTHVTAQAGATWKKIQKVLALYGRSVKVMQSDNIFTVGGSIAVNVHGWQVGLPPIASTILNMTVVTADGKIHEISPSKKPELFKAVIGGYGMFAVIVKAELETMPNSVVNFHTRFTNTRNFDEVFQKNITQNPKTELAYARLSLDKRIFFNEVGLFWFETQKPHTRKRTVTAQKRTALQRAIFRLSEGHNLGKRLRWYIEKIYAKMLSRNPESLSRNDAMNPDFHVLWPLYGKNKDILHEYFIPQKKYYDFVQKLKHSILKHKTNLLNVTIREVRKDTISLLPYAKEDVHAFVCLFSQSHSAKDEKKMKDFTQSVINDVLALGGTFYLPYRLHYTADQLVAAYPEIKAWIALKKKYDPDLIFESQFFDYISQLLDDHPQQRIPGLQET